LDFLKRRPFFNLHITPEGENVTLFDQIAAVSSILVAILAVLVMMLAVGSFLFPPEEDLLK
jgi:hypothetical protein